MQLKCFGIQIRCFSRHWLFRAMVKKAKKQKAIDAKAKQRNPNQFKDFRKEKVKVGKKKRKPANHTDTRVRYKRKLSHCVDVLCHQNCSNCWIFGHCACFDPFKSACVGVAILEQSLRADKREVATQRNLTFDDLFTQLNHFSPKMRRGRRFVSCWISSQSYLRRCNEWIERVDDKLSVCSETSTRCHFTNNPCQSIVYCDAFSSALDSDDIWQ